MKKFLHLKLCLCLTGLFLTTTVIAQTWLNEGAREFEELRLQQLQTVQNESNIAAFTTDGCSGFQSQHWALLAKILPGFEKQFGNKPPWEACCVAHDKVYWRGDVVNGYAKRQYADETLKQCIIATGTKIAPQLSLRYSLSSGQIHLGSLRIFWQIS